MSSAIHIENLSVAFAGRSVLQDLSLEVDSGGPTVLLGRSGSGKTTLLRALNRLNDCLPGCTTTGSVRLRLDGAWLDAYARNASPEALRRRVGMVFQTPNPLPVSVIRNLDLPLALALGLGAAERAERAELALREARLWDEVKDRLDHPAQSLSGGQQQRLCLARALAFRPEILLLDEPTASLDFKAARGVEELLLELSGRYTVLLVSHSINQARRLARRLLVLRGTAGAPEAASEGVSAASRVEDVDQDTLAEKDRLLALMDELL